MSCCGGNCGPALAPSAPTAFEDATFTAHELSETTTTGAFIVCDAPQNTHLKGSWMGAGPENGCKCGANHRCDPCSCKKTNDNFLTIPSLLQS
uniref:Metallothionein-like protein n=1 Tax=Camellia sinensis TaxID=4442 RepID=F4YFE5_CAMSI|nr:metallothionin 2 [Camellia sinensis]AEM36338.1 metallothionin-like protein [Camellia sinensis]